MSTSENKKPNYLGLSGIGLRKGVAMFEVGLSKSKEKGISPEAMHSVEHLLRCYFFNISPKKAELIQLYAGASLTKIYLLLINGFTMKVYRELLEACNWAQSQDKVPSASKTNCSNSKLHNLEEAKKVLKSLAEALQDTTRKEEFITAEAVCGVPQMALEWKYDQKIEVACVPCRIKDTVEDWFKDDSILQFKDARSTYFIGVLYACCYANSLTKSVRFIANERELLEGIRQRLGIPYHILVTEGYPELSSRSANLYASLAMLFDENNLIQHLQHHPQLEAAFLAGYGYNMLRTNWDTRVYAHLLLFRKSEKVLGTILRELGVEYSEVKFNGGMYLCIEKDGLEVLMEHFDILEKKHGIKNKFTDDRV